MDPINYLGMVPQQDFLRDIQGGLQLGTGFREAQQLEAARDLAMQQKQVAMQRQQQYQSDVSAALAAPREQQAQLFGALALRNPEQYEAINKSFGALNADQQKNELRDTFAIASTLHADRPDLAKQQINDRITAMKNSGQPTQDLEALRDLVDKDPKAAYGHVLHIASVLPGGKDVLANLQSTNKDAREGAESESKLASDSLDQAAKAAAITGARAGALAQAKNLKPSQVETFLRTEYAAKRMTKAELDDRIASIPKDPAMLPDYLNSLRDAGIDPTKQKGFTTPDANAKLSAETQVRTTSMNNATQLAVQDRIAARQDAKGDAEANLDPETLTSMAQQYLAGDKSVMQNLGRGAQGSANIVALRKEITAQAKSQGMSGPAIAAKMAEFAGTMAGQRTAGTRIANVEMAANEAESLIPLAQQASAKVARSGFLPFGKAQVLFNEQTNDPAMRQFAAANNALVNVYARAISPSGTPTVADKEHGREMIATAMSHDAYMAVTQQMQREIAAARGAPQAVRKAFNGAVTGREMDHGAAPAAPSIPAGWSVKVH